MAIITHTIDAHLANKQCSLSIFVARKHGYYAGILYTYLLARQKEFEHCRDEFNKRGKVKWIPKLTYQEIYEDLPVFADIKAVKRTADLLEQGKLVLRESTGQFLEPDHVTKRKRDLATWWHAQDAEKLTGNPFYGITTTFEFEDALQYGIPQALILAHFRDEPVEIRGDNCHFYKRLSAVELEKELPMDERTARRHLKALLNNAVLIPHPKKAKLYRLA